MIILCLLMSLVGTVFTKNCGQGVLQLPNQCAIVKETGNEDGYFEADIACRDLGGQLLSIHNRRANIKVAAYATGVLVSETGRLYIGGDKHKNGVWTWIDGTKMDYTNWAPGQPDNSGGCITISLDDHQWYATNCRQVMPYICQIPSSSEHDDPACCGAAKTGQGLAVDFHLSIKLPVENHSISAAGTCSEGEVFNEGKCRKNSDVDATVVSNETPTASITTTTPTPTPLTTTEARSCPANWEEYKRNCYAVYGHEEKLTYDGGRGLCKNYGGDLVSIHSKEENALVADLIRNKSNFHDNPWIGLYWDGTSLLWTDGSPYEFPNGKNTSASNEMVYDMTKDGLWREYSRYGVATRMPDAFVCKAALRSVKVPA